MFPGEGALPQAQYRPTSGHRVAPKRKGNPLWGRAMPSISCRPIVTQFEQAVASLQLNSREEMLASSTLKMWVHKNFRHRYVPEWLLEEWNMDSHQTWEWDVDRS